ncbi:molybdenum cofactor guanylyltransferase [Phytoactinopolyspora mesophila]|uniref:molybdenum cofactor guanylyltransferase n=1 Tax=Phytoactinopolyspora mesophila TaxID=2650750 RepID=UPI001C9E2941|nr:nucleotidyltransferase family protein [Phytoactinopolyspora mesophila]
MADPARAAVILAGGAGRRLGGMDKPRLVVGGRPLLDTAIGACVTCAHVIVVGPLRPTERPVHWTIEEPAGSGPVAALSAGSAILPPSARSVVVLAADLPAITADVVDQLHKTLASHDADAALLTDGTGRRQPLTAVYRASALTRALSDVGNPTGQSMRSLLKYLSVATLADPRAAEDIDTTEDLARWTEHHTGHPATTPDEDDPARKDHQGT